MNQSLTIIAIAILAGIFAGGAFWVSVDLFPILGQKWAARRERKRLAAEAKAVKEDEAAGGGEAEE